MGQAKSMRWSSCVGVGSALLTVLACTTALADKYDDNDFLIAGSFSDNILIYDAKTLVFKEALIDGNFDRVRALGFDLEGNVASANLHGGFHLWAPCGSSLLTFGTAQPTGPVGVAVSPAGTYYIATQVDIREFDQSGTFVRDFGSGDYKAVAFLPGGVLWAGGGGSQGADGLLDVFDVATGQIVFSIPLDNTQQQVQAMHYSASTNTVLMADHTVGAVFERDSSGAFVRRMDAPGIQSLSGITRGPGGDVFATDFGPNESTDGKVHRWTADGSFVESVTVNIHGTSNILWTGNISGDCNSNGEIDALDIAGGTSFDCNLNSIPDECDVAMDTSPDCDSNGIPNDCVVCDDASDCDDCDESTFDVCFQGTCLHQPDCLERNPADLDADGDVDLADFAIFAACFGGPDTAIPGSCPFSFP